MFPFISLFLLLHSQIITIGIGPRTFARLLARSLKDSTCTFNTGWWWLEHFLFSHLLGISSSQLTFIFFRGVFGLNHQPVIAFLKEMISSTISIFPSRLADELETFSSGKVKVCKLEKHFESFPKMHQLNDAGKQHTFPIYSQIFPINILLLQSHTIPSSNQTWQWKMDHL